TVETWAANCSEPGSDGDCDSRVVASRLSRSRRPGTLKKPERGTGHQSETPGIELRRAKSRLCPPETKLMSAKSAARRLFANPLMRRCDRRLVRALAVAATALVVGVRRPIRKRGGRRLLGQRHLQDLVDPLHRLDLEIALDVVGNLDQVLLVLVR